jgi:hypothetical protein
MLFIYDDFFRFDSEEHRKDVLTFVSSKPDLVYLLDNIKPYIEKAFGNVCVHLYMDCDYEFPRHRNVELRISLPDNVVINDLEDWEKINEKEDALFDLIEKDLKIKSALHFAWISVR